MMNIAAERQHRIKALKDTALKLMREHSWDDAQQAWSAVLAENPAHFEANFHCAQIHLKQEQYVEAAAAATRAQASQADHVGNLTVLARALNKTGETERAARTWKTLSERKSDDFECWYQLGIACLNLKEFAEAAQALHKALSLHPADLNANKAYIDCLKQMERIDEAQAYLQSLRSNYPDEPRIKQWHVQFMQEFRRRKVAQLQANAQTRKAQKANASALLELRKRARKTVHEQHYAEAIEDWQTLANALPDDFEAHYQLGIAQVRVYQVEAALVSFTQALTVQPDHLGAGEHFCDCLSTLQRHEEVLTFWQNFTDRNPDNKSAQKILRRQLAARDFRERKRVQAVQAQLRQLKLDYRTACESSDFKLGVNICKQILTIESGDLETSQRLGYCLLELEQYEEALVHLEKAASLRMYSTEVNAIETDESNGAAPSEQLIIFERYSKCLVKLGRTDEAIAFWQRFVNQWPDNSAAQAILQRLLSVRELQEKKQANQALQARQLLLRNLKSRSRELFDNALYEQSAETCRELLLLDTDNFEALYRLGQCLYELTQYDEALHYLEKAVNHSLSGDAQAAPDELTDASSPVLDHVAVFERYSRCLQKLNRSDEAIQFWQEFVEKWPGNDGAQRVLQRLLSLREQRERKQAQEEVQARQLHLRKLKLQSRTAYDNSQYSDSAEICREILQLVPESFEALYRLGQCLFELEQYEEAVVYLEKATHQQLNIEPEDEESLSADTSLAQPDHLAVCERYSNCLQKLGRTEDAMQFWQRLLEQWPDNSGAQRILQRLEIIREQKARKQAQEEALARQIQLRSMKIQSRVEFENRQYIKAASLCEKILASEPDMFEALYRLGQCLFELEQYDDALAYLKKAAHQHLNYEPENEESSLNDATFDQPDHLAVCERYSKCLVKLNRTDEAIQFWQDFTDQYPDNIPAQQTLQRLLSTLGFESSRKIQARQMHLRSLKEQSRTAFDANQLLECVQLCHQVLELNPDNFETVFRICQCLHALEQFEEAIPYFELALNLNPHTGASELYIATLLRLHRVDDAIKQKHRYLIGNSNEISKHLKFAQFLQSVQRSEQAESYLQSLLEQFPEDADIALALSKMWMATGRYKEVEALLSPLLVLFPNHIDVVRELARNYYQMNDMATALTLYQRNCDNNGATPRVWRDLILHQIHIDKVTQAKASLKQAEQTLPESSETLCQLGVIAESALFVDDARQYFERAVAMAPEHNREAGLFYSRQGIIDRALAALRIATALRPNDKDAEKVLEHVQRQYRQLGWSVDDVSPDAGSEDKLVPELLYEQLPEQLRKHRREYNAIPGSVILLTSSLGAGGAERQLVTTIRGLIASGIAPELVTLFVKSLSTSANNDFYLDELRTTNIEVLELDSTSINENDPDLPAADIDFIDCFPRSMSHTISAWYREFIKRRPAVIHAWQDQTCLMAVVAAALAGVPRIILSTRSSRPDNPYRRLHRYMKRAYQSVMKLPNVVMCNNSRSGARDYEDWLSLPAESVKVIYNGIDLDLLLHSADADTCKRNRDVLQIPEQALVIGGVFRMSEEKRPLLWVETAAIVARKLPHVHFVIAGDGPLRDLMQERAEALGFASRLHMPGHVSVASWFLMMDVVLLTSRMEGLPNVLIEAQSFGIPVVAPHVGGIPETLEQGETGWTVNDADADKLAERLIFILENKRWRDEANIKAAEFAKAQFSSPIMIRRTVDLYRNSQHD